MKRTLLLLISLALSLLFCEGIVRIAGLGNSTLTRGALHRYDPDAGWTCQPNLDSRYVLPHSFDVRIRCNSRGLRDEEIPYTKPPGTTRIVVLGDSFMWGYGVENDETFASQLEQRLPHTQTVNLGANGYSTVQELIRFETEGLRYDPDWTILAFTWNDLEGDFDEKEGGRPIVGSTGGGILRIDNRPVRKHWKAPVKQWLRHRSRLFGFVEYSLELFKAARKEQRLTLERTQERLREETESGEASATPKHALGTMEFSSLDLYGPPIPEIDLAWEATRLLLRRIKELTETNGGRMLVITVASQDVMDASKFHDSVGEGLEVDWNRPSQRLADICASLGIAFFDLNPIFRRAPDPNKLFLKRNAHWSAEGQALAARIVAERIETLNSKTAPLPSHDQASSSPDR